MTFGNCVLKTGVIKWRLKLYVRFFSKSKNRDRLRFLSCCTRFVERCRLPYWRITSEEMSPMKTIAIMCQHPVMVTLQHIMQ